MKTVVVVRPDVAIGMQQPTWWRPIADAFEQCFNARGWIVKTTTTPITVPPDLVAGYGWKEVMRTAHERWPDRILHCDLGFWSRQEYVKLAYGDRWSPLVDYEYDGARLERHGVRILPTRKPGNRVLLCGMSAKAAGTYGLKPQEWETRVVKVLRHAGAEVTYRPKPTWNGATKINDADFDNSNRTIEQALAETDAVVSHHSNVAVDALAVGLPIYVDVGISRSMSVPGPEDAIGAEAPGIVARTAFVRQVAWHQWTLKELSAGSWLEPPAPLSGLSILTDDRPA